MRHDRPVLTTALETWQRCDDLKAIGLPAARHPSKDPQ